VRVLLDEQLPRQLAPLLIGHDVRTVQQQSWAGLKNGQLLDAAEAAGFRVVVTGDRNLQFQQNLTTRDLEWSSSVAQATLSRTWCRCYRPRLTRSKSFKLARCFELKHNADSAAAVTITSPSSGLASCRRSKSLTKGEASRAFTIPGGLVFRWPLDVVDHEDWHHRFVRLQLQSELFL
jgi:hypothetical protein